jgi:uncharacterized metal-binding protein
MTITIILTIHSFLIVAILYLLLQVRLQLIAVEGRLSGQQIAITKLLNDICGLLNTTNNHLAKGSSQVPKKHKYVKKTFI